MVFWKRIHIFDFKFHVLLASRSGASRGSLPCLPALRIKKTKPQGQDRSRDPSSAAPNQSHSDVTLCLGDPKMHPFLVPKGDRWRPFHRTNPELRSQAPMPGSSSATGSSFAAAEPWVSTSADATGGCEEMYLGAISTWNFQGVAAMKLLATTAAGRGVLSVSEQHLV